MNQLKKVLVVMAVAVALGMIGAITASAACTVGPTSWEMSTGSTRQVRIEGTAEAVSPLTLTATQISGTICATSTINLNYGTAIESNGAGPYTEVLTCTIGGVQTACAVLTVPTGANSIVLTFGADTTFGIGDTMSITDVRVSANAYVGTIISVLASSNVPAAVHATNPVTFTLNPQVVAVITTPSTIVAITPVLVLACNGAVAPAGLSITVKEGFNQVFTTAADETSFGGTGAPDSPVPVSLTFTFANVPIGVKIGIPVAGVLESGTVTWTTAFTGFTSASGSQGVAVTLTITADALTGANETVNPVFPVTVPATSTLPLAAGVGTVTVSLTGGAGTQVPRFVPNVQGTANSTALTVNICASYLLAPWVATFQSGVIDTGIAIANTGLDTILTVGQTGDCNLFFSSSDGSTQISKGKTELAGLGGIKPGMTVAFTLSSLLHADFTGYMFANCGFQYGHAFASITNPTSPNAAAGSGYLLDEILNPRALNVAGIGGSESLGQ